MSLAGHGLRAVVLVTAVLLAVTLPARRVSPLPDLVLVLVAAWALWRGPRAGVVAGLVGGWVLDLVPPGATPLGAHALSYALAGLVVGRFRHQGPVGAGRVALVTLLGAGVVEGVDVVAALAASMPVDLAEVGVRALLTATAAALLVPLVVGAERAVLRRRYG